MSALTDFAKEHQWGAKNIELISKAEWIVGKLSGAYEAYNSVLSVAEVLGIVPGAPNPIEELKNMVEHLRAEMLAGFNAVLEQGLASEVCSKLIAVGTLLGNARSAVNNVVYYPPGDPSLKSLAPLALDGTEDVLETLKGDWYWLRPCISETVFSSDWTGELPPPVIMELGAKLVWDYRLILPAFLEAITSRILVLVAVERDRFQYVHREEFLLLAQKLTEIHDRIIKEFEMLRVPEDWEYEWKWVLHGTVENGAYVLETPRWEENGRPYGVVDRTTGTALGDRYPEGAPNPPQPPHEDHPSPVGDYKHYEAACRRYEGYLTDYKLKLESRHPVRTMVRWIDLYVAVGLPGVRAVCNDLLRLASQAPFPGDAGDVWTLRRLDRAMHPTVYASIERPTTRLRFVLGAILGYHPGDMSFRRAVAV